MYKTNK